MYRLTIFANRESRILYDMILKPQDVFVSLKLASIGNVRWTYLRLANELHMSTSEIAACVKRGLSAGLLVRAVGQIGTVPSRRALLEFLIHGVQYAFPPDRGQLARGMPTAYAAPPLRTEVVQGEDPVPVWPYAEGTVRGISFSPLFRTAPQAANQDDQFYELLALVDALRGGRARERDLAIRLLRERL